MRFEYLQLLRLAVLQYGEIASLQSGYWLSFAVGDHNIDLYQPCGGSNHRSAIDARCSRHRCGNHVLGIARATLETVCAGRARRSRRSSCSGCGVCRCSDCGSFIFRDYGCRSAAFPRDRAHGPRPACKGTEDYTYRSTIYDPERRPRLPPK